MSITKLKVCLTILIWFAIYLPFSMQADEVVLPKFTSPPTATKTDSGKIKIEFTVSTSIDVEVAILDSNSKVVRHLAAGMLGGKIPPPLPLQVGLYQSIEWDGNAIQRRSAHQWY